MKGVVFLLFVFVAVVHCISILPIPCAFDCHCIICDSNVVQEISALDNIYPNCSACFQNACEFAKAQCIYPESKYTV